jgi:cobalt/nickel transport system ATP-binding protein
MTVALEYQDVSVCYEHANDKVLRSVTLSIEQGERVALMGLNGSGKTSLLLATVGLVPSEGNIVVCGMKLDRKTLASVRSKVGFLFGVPEDQLLFPNVLDDVAFGAIRSGLTREAARQSALEVMSALGVDSLANAPLYTLSHGQKQRIALAGALVTNPPVLLLDEPSAGLDPPAKRTFAQYLTTLPSTLLVATHDLEFASRVCHRYVLLDQGEIVQQGREISDVEKYWTG